MASIVVNMTWNERFVVIGHEEQQLPPPQRFVQMGQMEDYHTVKVLMPTYKVVATLDEVIVEVKRMLYEGQGKLAPTDAMPAVAMDHDGTRANLVPSPVAVLSLLSIDGGYLVRFSDNRDDVDVESEDLADKVSSLSEAKGERAVQALADTLRSVLPYMRGGRDNVETVAFLELSEVEAFMRERFATEDAPVVALADPQVEA